jgi:hypothetical protein
VSYVLNGCLFSVTLARVEGWVLYTLGPLGRLTQGERFPAMFPSMGLPYLRFRLRSVLAGYGPLSKRIYSVMPHSIQTVAQDHLFYDTMKGEALSSIC